MENVLNFQNLLNLIKKYDIVLLAYENEHRNTLKNVLKKLKKAENLKVGIIIVPEGGITDAEVKSLEQNGAKTITLGNRILRTETAGIVTSSIIIYELE